MDFTTLQQKIAGGTTSVVSVVQDYLATIRKHSDLNAFITVLESEALSQAELVDKKLREGTSGSLAGMVMGIKDGICVKDVRCTCGSRILENFTSLYDATAVARLKAADAVIVGKLNMDEFAMGSSTENSAFGRVKHNIDPERVPGGSSGGSAVAVAAGMVTASLGSDTGGSIRQPAALTGTVGVKPTYGRVSRYGLVAFASSLDCIGPFAANVRDAARVLNVISGHDPLDSTSSTEPVPDYSQTLTGDVKGLRVGIPKEYFDEGLDPTVRGAVEKALDAIRSAGGTVETISLPHSKYTIATYYIIATAEASSNLARYDGARYGYRDSKPASLEDMYVLSRTAGFGVEVKRRIMLGTYVLSAGYYDAYYRKAQRVRRLIQRDFLEAYGKVDCIITPTSPSTAFKAGEKLDDPLQMYLSDIYTVSANLAGIPGVSIPYGTDTLNLPIGVQILGKHFDEATILKTADFLERTISTQS